MIWFSCKECGKTHGRPETAIGATIFCDCGNGLIVPWESTAAEPPQAAAPEISPALKLEPVTFEAAPPSPGPPSSGPPPLRGRKRARVNRRDPTFCFNHEQVPREASCGDCGENFCGACLVAFDGADLCGPCKNYRVKNLQRAIPASNLSIVSLLVALLSGPITIGLLPTGRGGFPWWTLIALALQSLAIGLALIALREVEKDPNVSGRSLALTSLVSAGVTTALILLLSLYTPHLWT